MTVGVLPDVLLQSGENHSATAAEDRREVAAAKDFEALLIGQMLRSVREDGSGWLGTGDDEAGSAAYSLGEDQLAKAMAAGGGLGLAKVIAAGLASKAASAAP
jgi:Rod binding domain-containing protein